MAHSVSSASKEVVTVLLPKDSTLLSRIEKMRQTQVAAAMGQASLKQARIVKRPVVPEGLPRRITLMNKAGPSQEVIMHDG